MDDITKDRVPVRLAGARRAYLWLPRPLTQDDANEITKWLQANVEPTSWGADLLKSEPQQDTDK